MITVASRPAPPVLLGLVVGFVLLHMAGWVSPDWRWSILEWGAFDPARLATVLDTPGRALPAAATLVTHAFLHGNVPHLVFNSLIFLFLGMPVAARMGTPRFLLFFALTAVGGALAQGYLFGFDPGRMVGASAVVFGLGAARAHMVAEIRNLQGRAKYRYLLGQAGGWMFVNAVIYVMLLLLALRDGGLGIAAWKAHAGGYLVGALVAPVLLPRPDRSW